MEIFLIKALQLILSLSLLILLHEGGHFFFARLFKVRVSKFCLFFDPWFTPLKWKPKNSDTTYALGWLPLGGYCAIEGMVDETKKASDLSETVQPWEFRAKPAWQRLLIMLGGVMVNLFTAFVIYAMVLFTWGHTYVPIKNVEHGFKFNATAQNLGYRDGDIPLRTDKTTIETFNGDALRALAEASQVTVLREGQEVTLTMNEPLDLLKMMKEDPIFIAPLIPAVIDSVIPGSPAALAGVAHGDRIVAVNGERINSSNAYAAIRGVWEDVLVSGAPEDSARLGNVVLVLSRAGAPAGQLDTVNVHLSGNFMLGVQWELPEYKNVTKEYDLQTCWAAGVERGINVLSDYVSDLKYLASMEGARSVGSFGAIGDLFPPTWDWARFWEMTAFLSIILAFMNVLPIPALDGGHAFFLLVEVITRRKPSEKFMERAQQVGMFLLLALMALAIFNDFDRYIF